MASVQWRVVVVGLALLANLAVLTIIVGHVFTDPSQEVPANGVLTGGPTAPKPAAPRPTQEADDEPYSVEVVVSGAEDDALVVRERIQADSPMEGLTLRPPAGPSSAVRVDDLRVEAAGVAVAAPDTLTGATRVRPTIATDVVEVSYRLLGVIDRDVLAPDGRVLITLRSLVAGGPDGSSVLMSVDGLTVHNLVCPDLPLRGQLCGRVVGTTWRTPLLPLDDATVVAQVDLPVAAAPTPGG